MISICNFYDTLISSLVNVGADLYRAIFVVLHCHFDYYYYYYKSICPFVPLETLSFTTERQCA